MYEILIILSYSLMHTIEMASFCARVAGRIAKKPALGTTIHYSIYTGSRFFLIIILPILGYLIESGLNVKDYLNIVVISLLLMFINSLFIINRVNNLQIIFQKLFQNYSINNLPVAIIKTVFYPSVASEYKIIEGFSHKLISKKLFFFSFASFIFLVNGFFIAFYFSIVYIDYRLTMSQLTAAFHGIGAVLLSFYIDPMISRSIDNTENKQMWLKNIYSLLLGRMAAYFVSFIFFLVLHNFS